MKKKIAILLLASMLLSFSACNQKQEKKTEASQNTSASETAQDRETVYQVALLQSLTQGHYDGIIKHGEGCDYGA